MKNRKPLPLGTAGFTLVEILVVMAIIAGLAAVTLPAITQQMRKSDANRVAQDLKNLATSSQSFQADVRTLPGALEQLQTKITPDGTTAETKDVFSNAYTDTDTTAWAGPYIEKTVDATDKTLTTGFGATINKLITLNGAPGSSQFLRFTVNGLSTQEAKMVDKILDDGDVKAGRVQHSGTALTYDAIIGTT